MLPSLGLKHRNTDADLASGSSEVPLGSDLTRLTTTEDPEGNPVSKKWRLLRPGSPIDSEDKAVEPISGAVIREPTESGKTSGRAGSSKGRLAETLLTGTPPADSLVF